MCAGDSRHHLDYSSMRRGGGVEATPGLTQASPLVPAKGGCGGDSRPHSVQSTRPCEGVGGVEATLGLTQSSPLVSAKGGGVCAGDSRHHLDYSSMQRGGGGVEATPGLTQASPLVPAKGGCGGDSRPHSVQSTRPCEGVGGVEATLGLTQSSPLVSAKGGGVWRRLQASPRLLVPAKGGGGGGVEATLGLT